MQWIRRRNIEMRKPAIYIERNVLNAKFVFVREYRIHTWKMHDVQSSSAINFNGIATRHVSVFVLKRQTYFCKQKKTHRTVKLSELSLNLIERTRRKVSVRTRSLQILTPFFFLRIRDTLLWWKRSKCAVHLVNSIKTIFYSNKIIEFSPEKTKRETKHSWLKWATVSSYSFWFDSI